MAGCWDLVVGVKEMPSQMPAAPELVIFGTRKWKIGKASPPSE
jgi:hypothetical protein